MSRYLRSIVFLIAVVLFSSPHIHAQNVQWGHKIGGTGGDRSYYTRVAPNGNVVVAGYFSGITDLDPSAAVYNITSAGGEDAFLACYSPTGGFLWGFRIGGNSYDAINEVSFDAQSNVIAVGYFRGMNVDFDPSTTGTAPLTDNGSMGSVPWGGDGFVAKYSATGIYQWAFQIGGPWVYDMTETVEVDAQGNIYVAGCYLDDADLDPSAGTLMINGVAQGRSYLAKYTPGGQLIWGFGFLSQGVGGTDCGVRSMELRGNRIYICGFVEFFTDFDPSSNTVGYTNPGLYGDPYIAVYDTSGNYVNHAVATGPEFEQALDLALDPAGNIYIIGSTGAGTSSLTFGTTTVNLPGTDIFIAKYNNACNFQWVRPYGTALPDMGTGIVYADNHIFCTGSFSGTVDFDPSAATSNLVSAGNTDIFVAQYDLNGNYVCAFRAGSTGADEAWSINNGQSNEIYTAGYFTGTVDFDPTAATYNLVSTGNQVDAFVVKYLYGGVSGNFTVTGDTICAGQQAYITLSDTANSGTFTLTVNDGNNTYTFPGVQSGVPFALVPSPTITTTYTWSVAGGGQNVCGTTSGSSGNFTVLVNPQPAASAGPDVAVCNNSFVQLNGSGGTAFSWTPSSVLNNPNISNPTLTVNDTTITFTMITTNSNGCSDTDQVNVSTHASPVANTGTAGAVCAGNTVQLQASGGGSYSWYPAGNLSNSFIANPVFTGSNTTILNVIVSNQYNCKDTDQVTVTINPKPIADAGPDVVQCTNVFLQLNGTGGTNYSWTPSSVLNNANTATPTLTVTDTILTFTLITSNGFGCSDTDQVTVSVHNGVAAATAGADTSVCPGSPVQLNGSGGLTYNWFPSAGLNNPGIANPVYTGSTVAILNMEVTDQFGCKDTDQVAVNILPQPIADAGPDQEVCPGNATQLQANGGSSYVWYPTTGMTGSNSATPTVTVSTAMTYHVVATNTHGCSDTDMVQVSLIVPPAFGIVPEQDMCKSDSVMLYASGGNNYIWWPDNDISQIGTDTVIVWPATTTTYYVAITEPVCGYSDTQSVQVYVHESPMVKITQATPIGCGQKLGLLMATGANQYVWSPSGTLTDSAIANPASFTPVPTWYTVMGTDANGCVGYDRVLMRIINEATGNVFVPTVFTPNNDGKNDCYRIVIPPQVTEYELHIYNRFGNNVFNADDITDCWDGKYKGEPCDVGTYYYYYKMKATDCNFVKEGKGDITLVR
jgi:gliding motility-associated-like protein